MTRARHAGMPSVLQAAISGIEDAGEAPTLSMMTTTGIAPVSQFGDHGDFTAVLMRKDPPFDMEYVTASWLLEIAGREGARVFNDPRALRDRGRRSSRSPSSRTSPRRRW